MSRRTGRIFSDTDRAELLSAVGECRRACTSAMSKAPVCGDVYQQLVDFVEAVDDLAGRMTGDRQHFHVKGYATKGGPFAARK